ncbi:LOW QUALITY PROTEIN: hypothetical protein Smp_198510 [Schistosoma mansoni]|uniref:hypothetical protein n=1 Tax=Schistosoma mansoni TaxID=6183 RepID=UPI00022DCAC7|nr:LOW QUALITY PROTEIN: hypothetical protein Smp_198510 [Schistosoma mansoni]|eukprot:XP_018655378.1 LOW QUALITY PROTEIN: hypothetical protein Smp_198510 [Schistosoma mansoni]
MSKLYLPTFQCFIVLMYVYICSRLLNKLSILLINSIDKSCYAEFVIPQLIVEIYSESFSCMTPMFQLHIVSMSMSYLILNFVAVIVLLDQSTHLMFPFDFQTSPFLEIYFRFSAPRFVLPFFSFCFLPVLLFNCFDVLGLRDNLRLSVI